MSKKDEGKKFEPGIRSAFADDSRSESADKSPGGKIKRYVAIAFSAILILGALSLIWRALFPAQEWEQVIRIGPNYPTTHHTITSGGRCNTNPILLLFRYEDIQKDNNCLNWTFADEESKELWRKAGLQIRLQNGAILTKPAGVRREGIIDAVIDIRSTDNQVHEITLSMRCPCRE